MKKPLSYVIKIRILTNRRLNPKHNRQSGLTNPALQAILITDLVELSIKSVIGGCYGRDQTGYLSKQAD